MSSSQFPSGSFMKAIFEEDPPSEYGSMAIVTPWSRRLLIASWMFSTWKAM